MAKVIRRFFGQQNEPASSITIVLDGCDEAFRTDFRIWAELLKDLSSAQGRGQGQDLPRVRVLMFGRPDVVSALNEGLDRSVPLLPILSSQVESGIVRQVEHGVKKSPRLSKVPKKLQKEIIESLAHRANGMFLWVRSETLPMICRTVC